MKSKPTISKRKRVLVIAASFAMTLFMPVVVSAQSCESQPLPRAYFDPAPGPHDASGGYAVPSDPVKPITVAAPNASLRLFVAADTPSRELGLMCIVTMKPHTGMLFAFAQDGPQPFWMKNTLIPLDMVFVRGDGTVSSVAPDVPQSKVGALEKTLARRTGEGRYVLELNADEAVTDGIRPGVHLAIPAIPAQ